jgi:ribosomal protein L9
VKPLALAHIGLSFLLAGTVPAAHAQFGDLIKGLKQAVEQGIPRAATPTGSAAAAGTAASTEPSAAAAGPDDAFCQKVIQNPHMQRYLAVAQGWLQIEPPNRPRIGGLYIDSAMQRLLDQDGSLTAWVRQRGVESVQSRAPRDSFQKAAAEERFRKPVELSVAYCTARYVDAAEWLLFIKMPAGSAELAERRAKVKQLLSPPPSRATVTLDAQGNKVQPTAAPTPPLNEQLLTQVLRAVNNSDSDPFRDSYPQFDPWWAAMYALHLPNGDNALNNLAPAHLNQLSARLDEYKGHRAEGDRAARERSAQEARAVAQAEQESRAQAAFDASPEGQLFGIYRYWQLVETCHAARQGMALVYVTNQDHESLRQRTKAAEQQIKPQLKGKPSEQVWQDAAQRNRKSPLFGTATTIDLIESIQRAPFTAGQQDCRNFATTLDNRLNALLGKQEIRKSL